jgi:hypothetical protein
VGWDFGGQTAEFVEGASEGVLQLRALRAIQFDGGAGQPPIGAAGDGQYDLQIARQGGEGGQRWIGLRLPLGLQKQLRLFEQSLADGRSSVPPGGVQLPGFAAGEPVRGQRFCHALAVLQAAARHRHQILHRHLGRDRPVAHLLLHAFRQLIHQRQPARYPTGTAIKLAG